MVTFQRIPDTEPLALATGQTSPLFSVFVPVGREESFIRAVALGADNTTPPASAATFQLKSGSGIITSVEPGGPQVAIPGAPGMVAGRASCELLPDGVYLVSITEIDKDAGDWRLRVRNNSGETLRFACVSSHKEPNTRQPWMAVSNGRRDDQGRAVLSVVGLTPEQFVEVSNWGTAPLHVNDEPGSPLGGQNSPVVLVSRPSGVAPYGVDHMVVRCGQVDVEMELSHTFGSDDERPDHSTLELAIAPP